MPTSFEEAYTQWESNCLFEGLQIILAGKLKSSLPWVETGVFAPVQKRGGGFSSVSGIFNYHRYKLSSWLHNNRNFIMLYIRSFLFYFGYTIITFIHATLNILFSWLLPFKQRFYFMIVLWSRMILFWLKLTCNISVNVSGLENIPNQRCVILSKHQSTFETLFLQTIFYPQATIIRKSLLYIPFWGWSFALCQPIAINRSTPRKALKQVLTQGAQRLKKNMWVLIFPEGKRTYPGQTRKFLHGGAMLAKKSAVPVLPVAHNSGLYWPAHKFIKNSGVIQVSIGKAISSQNKNEAELTEEAKNWIDEQTKYLENMSQSKS